MRILRARLCAAVLLLAMCAAHAQAEDAQPAMQVPTGDVQACEVLAHVQIGTWFNLQRCERYGLFTAQELRASRQAWQRRYRGLAKRIRSNDVLVQEARLAADVSPWDWRDPENAAAIRAQCDNALNAQRMYVHNRQWSATAQQCRVDR